jgi:hypothetical protein
MRITVKHAVGQLLLLLTVASFFSCIGRKDESPVIPPVTSPLSRDYIGYGVITASFTHITPEPSQDSASLGYLRRGALVRIIKRQNVRVGGVYESWVQIDGDQNGWLKEEIMDIYNTESQAKTASESILK